MGSFFASIFSGTKERGASGNRFPDHTGFDTLLQFPRSPFLLTQYGFPVEEMRSNRFIMTELLRLARYRWTSSGAELHPVGGDDGNQLTLDLPREVQHYYQRRRIFPLIRLALPATVLDRSLFVLENCGVVLPDESDDLYRRFEGEYEQHAWVRTHIGELPEAAAVISPFLADAEGDPDRRISAISRVADAVRRYGGADVSTEAVGNDEVTVLRFTTPWWDEGFGPVGLFSARAIESLGIGRGDLDSVRSFYEQAGIPAVNL